VGRRRDVRDNDGVPPAAAAAGPTYYRLAPHVAARLLGLSIVALAVVVFVVTAVVFGTGAGYGWIFLPLLVGAALVLTFGWWLRSKAYVVRCASQGYRVRFVRGAGVHEARWAQVQEAATSSPHGTPILVLRLKDGRTTSIPVGILAVDREQFVREMQRHLSSGIRPLSR